MPILNYTTTIGVSKTVGEIQEILAKAGVRTVIIEYDHEGIPESVFFEIKVAQGSQSIRLSYRLPSRWQGVWYELKKNTVEKKYQSEEQARRVAWRIIKDWIEAQTAIVQAGAAELTEVFFPYMINGHSNETVFEHFKSGFLLNPGDTVEGVEIKS